MRFLVLLLCLAALPAGAQSADVPAGSYECWYFTRAQPGLNFRIDGKGQYTDIEGKRGSYQLGADNRLVFKGGAHDGDSAVFKPLKTPTVSFLGPRGAEAAFCERAGK